MFFFGKKGLASDPLIVVIRSYIDAVQPTNDGQARGSHPFKGRGLCADGHL